VGEIVKKVKLDIQSLGLVNIEEGLNLEQHDSVVPILRDGCEALYGLKVYMQKLTMAPMYL
jgi:hypothetical protein